MDEIFGVPISQFMMALLLIFGVGVVIIAVVALRNRVLLKMAARNIPRRRAQTALIVLGLMLATLLFSASLTTGDTLTHSIRTQALGELRHWARSERSTSLCRWRLGMRPEGLPTSTRRISILSARAWRANPM